MALTNAQRQRRYRERRKAQQPRLHYRRPQDRSSGRTRYAPCSTFRMSTKGGSTTSPTVSGSPPSHTSCRRFAPLILPNWTASSRGGLRGIKMVSGYPQKSPPAALGRHIWIHPRCSKQSPLRRRVLPILLPSPLLRLLICSPLHNQPPYVTLGLVATSILILIVAGLSGRREGRPSRPPTPPCVRDRTRRFKRTAAGSEVD